MTEEKNDFFIHPAHIRVGIIMFLTVILFSIIGIQLWNMQINNNSEYNDKISRQSVRMIRIPPVRGRVYASDGRTMIAGNRVSYDLQLHFSEMDVPRRKLFDYVMDETTRIADCIGRKNTLTRDDISRHMYYSPGIPMKIFEDLTEKELGKITEIRPAVNGLEITTEPVRIYPYHSLASQIIGYVGASDPKQASDRGEYFYYIPEVEGKSGLENKFNNMLKGKAGKKLVIVNNFGFVHEEIETPVSAENGYDIVLTMDLKAQQAAEQLIAHERACIAVMDASTGAILVMASSPGFDPQDFIPRISGEKYAEIINNPGKPFINKIIRDIYMPGSIIKPLVALAFLENGLSPDDTVTCTGVSEIGGQKIRCSNRYGHGPITVEEAIRTSCNCFFIELAGELGIEELSKTFRAAGIGRKTGFELTEAVGHLPQAGRDFLLSDVGYVSIGQGKISLTPLQALTYISAIANGGTVYQPYIVDRIINPDGKIVEKTRPTAKGKLWGRGPGNTVKQESLDIVSSGMYLSVNGGGTSRQAKNSKIELHGKTGSAQVGDDPGRYTNTWFTGFGVDQKTQKIYSIIVLVEHGASGGGTAAPLARDFFERWL